MSEDLHPDKIFVKNHFTDYEKLCFAKAEIKDLKTENTALKIELGKLRAFVDELDEQADKKILNDLKSVKGENARWRAEVKRLYGMNKTLREELNKLQTK